MGAIDDIRARAEARAGSFLANEWRATRDVTNHAGELVAQELTEAQKQLGEITGEVTSDDLLGRIFSSFCIGK